jgi:hypothetical protein
MALLQKLPVALPGDQRKCHKTCTLADQASEKPQMLPTITSGDRMDFIVLYVSVSCV